MPFGIEAISGIAGETVRVHATGIATNSGTMNSAAPGFEKLMSAGIDQVNADIANAEAAMSALARGEPVELHQVMISMEKARISAMALVQIRNRLVEAYQEVTRMQV